MKVDLISVALLMLLALPIGIWLSHDLTHWGQPLGVAMVLAWCLGHFNSSSHA